uniref:Uncharacterized protein n=1 Tax=viral metagenome TaxID=1070528 RepID=A0A6C0D3F3_9ZZZZ
MAYCILDISSHLVIRDWTILNLMEAEIPKHVCSCTISNKSKKNLVTKLCTKLAKYKKNEKFYCDKHAKSDTQFMLPAKQYLSTNLKKQKVQELIHLGKKHGLENLAEQKKDKLIEIMVNFFENRCYENITIAKSKTAGETDLIQIGRNMKEQLDKIDVIETIDYVVIENQISPIATRMKTIQGMLAQYFIMKVPRCHIDFVSSSHKLKQFVGLEKPVLENTIVTNSYKEHKKDGIHYCTKLLEKNTGLIGSQLFAESPSKKKDDLADCFLQGLWYLKQKNIIIYADDLKINIV